MPLLDLPGAIGPSYLGVAPEANAERCVNLIAEKIEANGKSAYYYTKAPGLSGAVAMPAGTPVSIAVNSTVRGAGILVNSAAVDPAALAGIAVNSVPLSAPIPGPGIAAGVYINGRRFFIVNDALWELTGSAPPFSVTNWGATGPVSGQYVRYSIAVNIRGNQLCIASNNVTSVFNLATNTFTAKVMTPEVFLQVDELDGYFLGLAASGNFYISNYQDGTIWNALNFAFEQAPDLTMGFRVCNRRLWMFGSNHIEVYVDSGDPNFPLTRDQSVYVEGGAYRNSLCLADNTIFGIAVNAGGAGWAFRLNGVTPLRISTHAVEASWQNYATVRDVIPTVYQENGHTIVVWHFPTGNASWAYDVATGFWTERGAWNATTGNWDRDFAAVHIYDANLQMHLAGDYRNSSIYIQSQNYYDFNGVPIYWMRRFPGIQSDQTGILYDLVRLIMEEGVTGTLPANTAPVITLRVSNDGGYTFSPTRLPVNAGVSGDHYKRLDWTQLGYSRDRIFEISGHDPMPLAIIALKGSIRPCFT